VPYGQSVTLSALVTDVVDGELDGTALLWRCPREGGVVATGKTTSHVFTNPATNTLHLSATNSIGLTAEATVTIKVEGPYVTVTIAQPAFDGFRVYFGDSLHLEGSCTDSWFGSLTGDAVRWTSNPPGLTGTGTSFTTTSLAPGVYLVALEATDPVGRSGRAERLLEILPDSHPSVLITQPLTAVSILHGDEVYFDGYAMDPDEGVLLPSQVRWESSADGLLATSPSLATTSLSTGVHDVSLVAINSRGRTSAATIAVTVLERPWVEVTVSSPRDGETTFAGDPVALVGAATDRVLGRLDGSSLVWRSDLQGDIGSGEQCSVTTLMIGTHRVELDASGSEGHVGQATATLHVQPEPPPLLSIVEPSGGCVVFPHEAVTLHAETLSGRGFMPVPEEQLHWSMDGVVLEGTGSTLSVTGLSLGTHEVQLSAPSLYGTTPTSTVTFQIVQPGTVIGLFSVHRLPVVTAQAPVPMFSGSGEPTSPAFVTDRALRLRVVNNSRRELRAKLGHPDQPLQFVASNELRGDDGQLLSRCMVDPTTDPATSMEVILPASAPVAVVDFSFKSPADWGSHVPSHDFFVEVCDTGGVPLVHVGGFAVLGREPLPPAAEVHQPIPGSVLRAGEALLAVGEGVDPIDGALAAEALSWSLDEGLPCGTGPLSWSAVLRRVSTA
jgi:hypothetical protein